MFYVPSVGVISSEVSSTFIQLTAMDATLKLFQFSNLLSKPQRLEDNLNKDISTVFIVEYDGVDWPASKLHGLITDLLLPCGTPSPCYPTKKYDLSSLLLPENAKNEGMQEIWIF